MKKLNFGSGIDIHEGWDNWDCRKIEGVNKILDFNKYPYPVEDNTYDHIKARQILQLLEKPDRCLFELHRIAKKNSIIHVTVSHYNGKGSHNDINTRFYFNEHSFKLFAEWNKDKFELVDLYFTLTPMGKIIFIESIRKFLNLFFSGIYENIEIELRVKKE